MKNRRILAAILGALQSIIGILLAFLVVFLFFNIFQIRIILSVSTELLPLYIIVLSLFSTFSIANGFFLIRESRGII